MYTSKNMLVPQERRVGVPLPALGYLVVDDEEPPKVHAGGHVGRQQGVGRLERGHRSGDAVGQDGARHGAGVVREDEEEEGAAQGAGPEDYHREEQGRQ